MQLAKQLDSDSVFFHGRHVLVFLPDKKSSVAKEIQEAAGHLKFVVSRPVSPAEWRCLDHSQGPVLMELLTEFTDSPVVNVYDKIVHQFAQMSVSFPRMDSEFLFSSKECKRLRFDEAETSKRKFQQEEDAEAMASLVKKLKGSADSVVSDGWGVAEDNRAYVKKVADVEKLTLVGQVNCHLLLDTHKQHSEKTVLMTSSSRLCTKKAKMHINSLPRTWPVLMCVASKGEPKVRQLLPHELLKIKMWSASVFNTAFCAPATRHSAVVQCPLKAPLAAMLVAMLAAPERA